MANKFKMGAMIAAAAIFMAAPSLASPNAFRGKLLMPPDTACAPCASKGRVNTIALAENDLNARIAFAYRAIIGSEMPKAEAREEDAKKGDGLQGEKKKDGPVRQPGGEAREDVKKDGGLPEPPAQKYSADEMRANEIIAQGTDAGNAEERMGEIEKLLERGGLSAVQEAQLRGIYQGLAGARKEEAPAMVNATPGSAAAAGEANADSVAVVNELRQVAGEFDKNTGQIDSYGIVMDQMQKGGYAGQKFVDKVKEYVGSMLRIMSESKANAAAPADSAGARPAMQPEAAADTSAQAATAQTDAQKYEQIRGEGTEVKDAEGRMGEIEALLKKSTLTSEQAIELRKIYKALSALVKE
ncbi:MAG: hypothetical protein WC717_04375 [Candidatus Micrarchaeia archaeon]|jgi:hypothetical protein